MATSLRPSSVEAAHIYMASPFALYFYSVYRPGLAFISTNSALSWLSFFFLPHIVVETSSTFVNFHNAIGAALFWVGFLTFCLVWYASYRDKPRGVTDVRNGGIR